MLEVAVAGEEMAMVVLREAVVMAVCSLSVRCHVSVRCSGVCGMAPSGMPNMLKREGEGRALLQLRLCRNCLLVCSTLVNSSFRWRHFSISSTRAVTAPFD